MLFVAMIAVCLLLADRSVSVQSNEDGLKLLHAGRTQEAEQRFRDAVTADPKNFEALNNLGVLLKRENKFTAAVGFLRKAAQLAPKDARIHSNLAGALRGSGDLAGAVAEMKVAASLDPASAAIAQNFALYSREYGTDLYRRGDLDRAIAQLRKAAELAPDDSAAHFQLGRALTKLGRSEEAAAELKMAQRQNQQSRDLIRAKALNNEGNGLLQTGDLEGGLEKLEQAVALAAGDAVCQYNYGVALLLANHVDEALDHFLTAVRLDPAQGNGYYYIGKAQMLKRDWRAAVEALEHAIQLNPGDDAAGHALAEARQQMQGQ